MGKSTWFKSYRDKENPEEDATIPTASGGGRKRKAVGGEEIATKRCIKEQDPKQIITTSVMFVDSTPHGVLCARLQSCEDRIGVVTDWRVKMVEMGGSQLSQQFSNTDPWSGAGCEREDCYTCHQGGEEKKEDCFRRNILYESRCVACQEEQERELKSTKKKSRKIDSDEKGVYVGESSRSLYERTKEHWNDAVKDAPDNHMRKHWVE